MPPEKARSPLHVAFDNSGICILESHHGDDFRMDWCRHDFFKILLVIAGSGDLLTKADGFHLSKSTLLLVPPNIEHRLTDDPGHPLSIYVLCIRRDSLGTDLRAIASKAPTLIRDPEILAFSAQAMRRLRIEKTRNLPGHALISTGTASLLLGQIQRLTASPRHSVNPPSYSPAEEKVRAYITTLATGFSEPDTLDSVAQRLSLSRRRFTQIFRQITGESWLGYVHRLRLEHAIQLLRDESRSIAAIAFECGFGDLSSFYRAFKSHTGHPPHRWRSHSN